MFSQKNISLAVVACFLFIFEGSAQQLIENKNEKNHSQEWISLIEPFFDNDSSAFSQNEEFGTQSKINEFNIKESNCL